jgi:hypothetical protein
MSYLDATPVISALRTSPNAFEFVGGALRHIPSRHHFYFERGGHVRLAAECDCSYLTVNPEQEPALTEAFSKWRVDYWRPAEINRQFAEHFNPPSGWRRILLALTERLHRALLSETKRAHVNEEAASCS